jgi:hypothetical protein
MPRKQKTIHYLYKTTCLVTDRYYIGMHSTINLEDGYMGSGKRLRYSIRKYGKKNHIKEILKFFGSRELLIEAEKSIVNSDLIRDKMCMNLKEGGSGGLTGLNDETIRKIRKGASDFIYAKWQTEEFKEKMRKISSREMKKRHECGLVKYNTFTGRKHKPETIEKLKGHKKQVGILNSQYGTMWITNGAENRKIKKEEVIPEGWYKGRKLLKIKGLADD